MAKTRKTVRKKKPARTKKTFVLDTNVLLHNCEAIESFADNTVVIPMAVIEELDRFKTHNDELGRNARGVIRRLDILRVKGNLRDGVPINEGGMLKIIANVVQLKDIGLEEDIADNRILAIADALHRTGDEVVFVSKDINARLKADALGLRAVDFERQKINFDDLYRGYTEIEWDTSSITDLEPGRTFAAKDLGHYPNEFMCLTDLKTRREVLCRVLTPGSLKVVANAREKVWNVRPRNREQRMALDLLMDPKVQVVTLVGQAGTGKTLVALAAALESALKGKKYDCILVSRPIIPMGKDIGYLPGDKDEKLAHWMQPIFDNLGYLFRDGTEPGKGGTKKKTRITVQDRIEKLMSDKVLALEALTYIRGRSIPNQYVIIDEAQNLTPHEVKTIVSRAGEGTKMVLTGDPYQIDNPYLDASSNGLTYAAERLKGEAIHGHVTLVKSERSVLAALAAEKL